jgi:hypothetical protein
MRRAIGMGFLMMVAALCTGPAGADDTLPNPVRTCTDLRAYIDGDTMTMDRFKALMTAAGADLTQGGNDSLDMQCKLTAVVKNVVIVQRVMRKDDGGEVRVATQVVTEGGICKLTKISVDGC